MLIIFLYIIFRLRKLLFNVANQVGSVGHEIEATVHEIAYLTFLYYFHFLFMADIDFISFWNG